MSSVLQDAKHRLLCADARAITDAEDKVVFLMQQHFSERTACAAAEMPRDKFRRAQKAHAQHRAPYKIGHPSLLTAEEEACLIDWVKTYFPQEGEDPEIPDICHQVCKSSICKN